MTDAPLKSWHYRSGGWVEGPDLINSAWGDDDDEAQVMKRLGFAKQHTIGEPEVGLSMVVWGRAPAHQAPHFVISLETQDDFSYVYAAALPDVWDVMARWSPVVRDDALTRLIASATDAERGGPGLIEMIARRAAWGAQQPYEQQVRRPNGNS